MRQLLKLHPRSQCFVADQVEVRITRSHADRLGLAYVVTGNVRDIRMPLAMAPARGNELWRHTCFEAFVRSSLADAYYEFNFAPSTQWAAYRFSSYRSGTRDAYEIGAPAIEAQMTSGCFTLQASLDLDHFSDLPRNASWHLALSAVIEDTGGRMSYWALVHPPGKPDFHHPDSFVHELSEPAAP